MPDDNVPNETFNSSSAFSEDLLVESTETGDGAHGGAPAAGRPLLPALIAGTILLLLGAVYLVDWLITKEDIQHGTSIAGVELGGLTPADAVARLQSEFDELETPITVWAHGNQLTLDPAASGLSVDVAASVAAAGTRSANPFTRISALFGSSIALPLIATVDSAALTTQLHNVAAASDVASVEAQLSLSGTTVTAVPPVTGQKLDMAAAVTVITNAWTSGNPASVEGLTLPVTEQAVRSSAAKLTEAAADLAAVLSGPLTVVAGETTFPVSLETIARAVTVAPDNADGFTVSIDVAAIKAGYQAQVEGTQSAPVDAAVAIVDNAPLVTPSIDGQAVDWAATDADLPAALRAPDHRLVVRYVMTQPTVTTDAVNALGITEVISEFTTGGFATDSGRNVKRAAEEVQGAIVLPGATFSLNAYTGPRGVDQGYVEAGIIDNGVASRGVGGGISQFATTLFNASYFAGMTDIEHKAHSYYISRYPPGREATVFTAEDGTSLIDVKFENVSSTAILIQTIWTPTDITVKFWGTKAVDVESIAGERYNYTSPPAKTIPYGQTCKATSGSQGFSIDVTKVIRDLAGAELSRETKTTVYNGQVKISCAPPPTPTEPPAPPAPASGG